MIDDQLWEFTYTTCGGHKLTVYRVWNILAGPDSETWQEWGPVLATYVREVGAPLLEGDGLSFYFKKTHGDHLKDIYWQTPRSQTAKHISI